MVLLKIKVITITIITLVMHLISKVHYQRNYLKDIKAENALLAALSISLKSTVMADYVLIAGQIVVLENFKQQIRKLSHQIRSIIWCDNKYFFGGGHCILGGNYPKLNDIITSLR